VDLKEAARYDILAPAVNDPFSEFGGTGNGATSHTQEPVALAVRGPIRRFRLPRPARLVGVGTVVLLAGLSVRLLSGPLQHGSVRHQRSSGARRVPYLHRASGSNEPSQIKANARRPRHHRRIRPQTAPASLSRLAPANPRRLYLSPNGTSRLKHERPTHRSRVPCLPGTLGC
jgi:hypothetical protein